MVKLQLWAWAERGLWKTSAPMLRKFEQDEKSFLHKISRMVWVDLVCWSYEHLLHFFSFLLLIGSVLTGCPWICGLPISASWVLGLQACSYLTLCFHNENVLVLLRLSLRDTKTKISSRKPVTRAAAPSLLRSPATGYSELPLSWPPEPWYIFPLTQFASLQCLLFSIQFHFHRKYLLTDCRVGSLVV